MVLSFIVIERKNEEKMLVYKNRKSINMNSVEGINYLAESSENSQIFTELEKKED
jgi:hypothetical protein